MNKDILEKCVVLIGLDGKAKDAVSKNLAEKLGYREVDFRLMEFCPYTTERIEVEIELAKRHLNELKTKLKFSLKPTRKEKIKNEIEETKQYILDMHNRIPLRESYFYVNSFPYIGFDRNIEKYIKENHDEKTYNVYLKKFENKLFDSMTICTKEPSVFKMPASAANVLQSEEEVCYESADKKLSFRLFKNDKEKVASEMKKIYDKYKNVVYLSQDLTEKNTEIEKEFVTDGQFEELATSVVDINGLIDENEKVDEDKLNSVTDQIIFSIEHNVDDSKIVENNENNEKAI